MADRVVRGIVTLALGGLLVPRLVALRQMAIAGLGTLGLCLLLAWLLGPDGGRPPVPQLSGVDARYRSRTCESACKPGHQTE